MASIGSYVSGLMVPCHRAKGSIEEETSEPTNQVDHRWLEAVAEATQMNIANMEPRCVYPISHGRVILSYCQVWKTKVRRGEMDCEGFGFGQIKKSKRRQKKSKKA